MFKEITCFLFKITCYHLSAIKLNLSSSLCFFSFDFPMYNFHFQERFQNLLELVLSLTFNPPTSLWRFSSWERALRQLEGNLNIHCNKFIYTLLFSLFFFLYTRSIFFFRLIALSWDSISIIFASDGIQNMDHLKD